MPGVSPSLLAMTKGTRGIPVSTTGPGVRQEVFGLVALIRVWRIVMVAVQNEGVP